MIIRFLLCWLLAQPAYANYFKKLRDEYRAGRREVAASKEEKRMLDRRVAEQQRRRFVFERNVKRLVDGFHHRMKKKSIGVWLIGGTVLVIYLCHRGSVGCDRDDD